MLNQAQQVIEQVQPIFLFTKLHLLIYVAVIYAVITFQNALV
jgi:hypothetical protein